MSTHTLAVGSCKPFLELLTWFIKKSKDLNLNDIASDIAALTLRLGVYGSLSSQSRVQYVTRKFSPRSVDFTVFCDHCICIAFLFQLLMHTCYSLRSPPSVA